MSELNGGEKVSAGTESSGSTSAEAKRLAARRRFLLGGAAALPVIVTLGQKQAWAASMAVCQSLGLPYDKNYSKGYKKSGQDDDKSDDDKEGWRQNVQFQASMYCDPNQRW